MFCNVRQSGMSSTESEIQLANCCWKHNRIFRSIFWKCWWRWWWWGICSHAYSGYWIWSEIISCYLKMWVKNHIDITWNDYVFGTIGYSKLFGDWISSNLRIYAYSFTQPQSEVLSVPVIKEEETMHTKYSKVPFQP